MKIPRLSTICAPGGGPRLDFVDRHGGLRSLGSVGARFHSKTLAFFMKMDPMDPENGMPAASRRAPWVPGGNSGGTLLNS